MIHGRQVKKWIVCVYSQYKYLQRYGCANRASQDRVKCWDPGKGGLVSTETDTDDANSGISQSTPGASGSLSSADLASPDNKRPTHRLASFGWDATSALPHTWRQCEQYWERWSLNALAVYTHIRVQHVYMCVYKYIDTNQNTGLCMHVCLDKKSLHHKATISLEQCGLAETPREKQLPPSEAGWKLAPPLEGEEEA